MKCNKGLEVKVLKCGSGYYIGTMIFDDEIGIEVPNCRTSVDYFRTEAEAGNALKYGYESRTCMENQHCAGAQGCGLAVPERSIGGMMVRRMIEQYEKGI